MILKRIYILIIIIFYFILGCGDLETEIKDKMTVVLKLDFEKRNSSRNNSNISSSELSQYYTHLIVAVPALEQLNSNYLSYYYSAVYADLMNPNDKRVSMEIPMNTELKIFAFLFQGNYSLDDLLQYRVVGAFGQSESFLINNQTNNIILGISLQSTGNSTSTTSTSINSSIEEVFSIGTTNDSTPNYIFTSTIAGTITYGGSCSSSTANAIVGNNSITLNFLSHGIYSDCTIKVTDSLGNESNTLNVTEFKISDTTLLAHYKFENDLTDNSSYGLDLTNGSGSVVYSQGRDGKAAWFNQSYAYTDDIEIAADDNWTISFWIKPYVDTQGNIGMDQWDSVMSTGDSTDGGRFQIDYSGYDNLRFNVSGLTNQSIELEGDEWQHFVYARAYESGTNGNKRISKYRNGESYGTTISVETRWDKLKIGLNRGGSAHWKGYIDDFRIYKRTLTTNEVEELYESYE
tara:strand:- start:642 stop:2024 length:1383 start_codon:yes stop_codon:yes gene_type:complete